MSGDSPGWLGSVAASTFDRQNQSLVVPDGTVKLRVNLASGGASLVTGTMLIDDLSVQIGALRITAFGPQTDGFNLTWSSVSGKTYTVQFADTFSSPTVWTSLATGLDSGGLSTSDLDTTPHTGNGGFYRVIQE